MKHIPVVCFTCVAMFVATCELGTLAQGMPATPIAGENTWAVVALDHHVGVMIVGEETVVPFRVLAEGRDDSPVSGATVVFALHNNDTGVDLTEFATETATPGHYEVRITVDDYQHWSWTAWVFGNATMNPTVTGFPWFRGVGPGSSGGTLSIPNQPPDTINVLPEWLAPSALIVEAGRTVTWVNDRDVPFFIFGAGGPFEQLGPIEPGASVSWTYDEPGEWAYVIGPAPHFMRGTIRVT